MRRAMNRLWWRWAEWRASRDIKAGRVCTFDDSKDALEWLRSAQFRTSAWRRAGK